jgi:uncharacterized protein YydD (DUF2326 family)
MFLKSLSITKGSSVIRDIKFRKGINLIVDERGLAEQITGNNVGKTTVLKLIDFCLGADKNNIWIDPETKKDVYALVKDFLIDNEVLITLTLTENLEDENASEIVIERNFLSRRNKIIHKINGESYSIDKDFKSKLKELIFPNCVSEKPSFREIISHNIRYKNLTLDNTLKTLDPHTSDVEYEALYLFLLGCQFTNGDAKLEITQKIQQETIFKSRLERTQTKSGYEAALSIIDSEIERLDVKKSSLNINENFKADFDKLNQVRYEINKLSSEISKLNIRKELINEAGEELNSSVSTIDLQELGQIYEQVAQNIQNIHKSFEDLVAFHNQMIFEKKKFILGELPAIEQTVAEKNKYLNVLLKQELDLAQLISKSASFEELETLMSEINEKYKQKGEYETTIKQIEEVENNLKEYNERLRSIDDELFGGDFELRVKQQVYKFNKYFSSVSEHLYKEQYALKYDIEKNRKGQPLYKFSAFNVNLSSGKKQGEISCFDIAYTLFADDENMPCLHFILNDKKELMDDNQLVKIAEFVNGKNIQFVASILKDKLPEKLNEEEFFVLKLSEQEKLFKIENDSRSLLLN